LAHVLEDEDGRTTCGAMMDGTRHELWVQWARWKFILEQGNM